MKSRNKWAPYRKPSAASHLYTNSYRLSTNIYLLKYARSWWDSSIKVPGVLAFRVPEMLKDYDIWMHSMNSWFTKCAASLAMERPETRLAPALRSEASPSTEAANVSAA